MLNEKGRSRKLRKCLIVFGLCLLPLIGESTSESTMPDISQSQCNRRELKNAGFSIALPEDMKEIPVQGIDSVVFSFESPTLKLLIDYGAYSDPLKFYPDGAVNVQIREDVIDGKTAKLVTYQLAQNGENSGSKFPYFAGAYFADLGRGSRFKLGLYANAKTPEAQASAMEIFDSIRLKA